MITVYDKLGEVRLVQNLVIFQPKGDNTMEKSTTIQEIVQRLENLSPGQQRQVLDFTLELSGESPKGISGKELLEFVGLFPPEDLEEIKQAIEEDCGQVDESEW